MLMMMKWRFSERACSRWCIIEGRSAGGARMDEADYNAIDKDLIGAAISRKEKHWRKTNAETG